MRDGVRLTRQQQSKLCKDRLVCGGATTKQQQGVCCAGQYWLSIILIIPTTAAHNNIMDDGCDDVMLQVDGCWTVTDVLHDYK